MKNLSLKKKIIWAIVLLFLVLLIFNFKDFYQGILDGMHAYPNQDAIR